MKKRLIIHHNDADGRCAAAVIRYYGMQANVDRRWVADEWYLEMDYKDPLPMQDILRFFEGISDRQIWVVDFSFPEKQMQDLHQIAAMGSLSRFPVMWWFDHHVTAISGMPENVGELMAGYRCVGTAACKLVWEYMFPHDPVPDAVDFVADRDVWAFRRGDYTPAFHEIYELEGSPGPEDEFWPSMFRMETMEDLDLGIRLYRRKMERLQKLALDIGQEKTFRFIPPTEASGSWKPWEAEPSLTVNEGRCLVVNTQQSGDLGQAIKNLGYDIAWIYYQTVRGGRLVVQNTLYSDKIDVGEIARRLGGGGHKGAAGWVMDIESADAGIMPWDIVLTGGFGLQDAS